MVEEASSSTMSPETLSKAVIAGIKKAQAEYEKITAGVWWQGPEYWVTIHVAKKLQSINNEGPIVLELGSNDVREEAGRKNKGRLPNLVKGKRYDIVVYFKNEKPRAVVEIKSWQDQQRILDDVEKVIAALRTAKLRFGAVGYFYKKEGGANKSAKEKIEDYIKELNRLTGIAATDHNYKIGSNEYIRTVDYSAWVAGCITIERR